MDVLDDRVKPILWKFCENKKADGYDAFTIKALMGHREMKTTEDISDPIDSRESCFG